MKESEYNNGNTDAMGRRGTAGIYLRNNGMCNKMREREMVRRMRQSTKKGGGDKETRGDEDR